MGLDKDAAEVEGEQPSRAYTIRFKGEIGLASKRVGKMLGLARTATGWRDFLVIGFESDIADTKVYMDVDKNRKTKRRELIGRRLCRDMRDDLGAKAVFHKKENGMLELSFVPLARIVVVDETDYRIEWNTDLCLKKQIDKKKYVDLLKSAMGSPGQLVVWG